MYDRRYVEGDAGRDPEKLQPVSIHGQMSMDVCFTSADDPDGQTSVARVGVGAVASTSSPAMPSSSDTSSARSSGLPHRSRTS